MHKNEQLELERVTPIETCSLIKTMLHCIKNRTPVHVLSNNDLFLLACAVHVTIFSIGNKFQISQSYSSRLFLYHLATCISLCCQGASVQDDVLSSLETKLLDVSSELVRDSEGIVKC